MYINNTKSNTVLNGGAGNDIISNWSRNVTIKGGEGNDSIYNSWDFSKNRTYDDAAQILFQYNVGDGNDIIYGFTDNTTLSIAGGQYVSYKSGDDIIVTAEDGGKITLVVGAAKLSKVNIVGQQGILVDKNFDNSNSKEKNLLIVGNDSANTIKNYCRLNRKDWGAWNYPYDSKGLNPTIFANGGNDSIYNEGSGAKIYGGDGNDSIENIGGHYRHDTTGVIEYYHPNNSTIDGGAGNDYIHNNDCSHVTIYGGAGDDTIDANGTDITVNGGKGNDSIKNGGTNILFTYTAGDGNDLIQNFRADSRLSITGGVHADTQKSGNDVIVTVGDAKITLQGAANKTVNIIETPVTIENTNSNKNITTTNANDTITNSGEKIRINALDGNDTITNTGDDTTIDGGAGNDTIHNLGANSKISGDAGNDSINNEGDNVTISGGDGDDTVTQQHRNNVSMNLGAGNDYVFNAYGSTNITIDGGKGNDFLNNDGSKLILSGGEGEDTISLYGGENITVNAGEGNDKLYNYQAKNVLYIYKAGDGNDVIQGFKADSTLSITGGVYASTAKSGNDVIVTVGNGKITLQGAATLSTVNIIETPWTFNNPKSNTTFYGTNTNDTMTNTGDKVTVQALRGNDSINNKAAQVSIDGGAGSDRIVNTGKNVTITAQAGNDTIANESANALISGGAGNDSIRNSGATSTVDGGDGEDTIENKSDTVSIAGASGDDSIKNDGNKVTIDGGAGHDTISSKSTSTSIIAADGNDLISLSGSYKNTIIAGKGSDTVKLDMNSTDIFIQYNLGEGDDVIEGFNTTTTLRIGNGDNTYSQSVSGDDLIITAEDGGKITLRGAATLSTVNIDGVTNINTINTANKVAINGMRLEDSIVNRGDDVTINTFAGRDTVQNSARFVTIDAGADVDYIANNNPNNSSINAGDGNDYVDNTGGYQNTILGGKGNDNIFLLSSEEVLIQYNEGDGRDYITDFNATSTLQIGDGTGSYYKEVIDDDVIITVDENKITLKGAATLSAVNILGEEEIEGKNVRNKSGGNTLVDGTEGNDSIVNYNSNVTINALGGYDSVRNTGDNVIISGGEKNDSITNEGYNVTIDGGLGNDRIYNDKGENVLFEYAAGDGSDYIEGFRADSTLSITGGLYSLQTSGNDIVLTVDDGKITLAGAASLETVNIIGVEDKLASRINNSTNETLVTGGNADDTVYNTGSRAMIVGYGGNDSLKSVNGNYVTIDGGAGNDRIINTLSDGKRGGSTGIRASLNGGEGNDYILNAVGNSATLIGGDGDDTLSDNAFYSRFIGGKGDDLIRLDKTGQGNEELVLYNTGDGNDYVTGFDNTSTLRIDGGSGAYSTQQSGNDIIVAVGDGKITLEGAANLSRLNIRGVQKEMSVLINNTLSGSSVVGTEGNDTINNNAQNVTLNALDGNDLITNNGSGNETSINAGAGDDTILNNHAQEVEITAAEGNDSIYNSGNDVSISAGAGNDTITNDKGFYSSISGAAGDDLISVTSSTDSTIDGGAGNDTITNDKGSYSSISGAAGNDLISVASSTDSTINGGAGNDTIKIDSDDTSIEYKSGDGNDLIQGFDDNDTLSITGAAFSTIESGDDVIVAVGNGRITLEGAAESADDLNIVGTETVSTASVNLTVANSKVTASNLYAVANAYRYNQNFALLNVNSALGDSLVKITNAEDSAIKTTGTFGTAILSSGNALSYQLNSVALSSETYNDKITFSKDTTFTYGDIKVELLAGSVISTKGAKEITFDNNSSANITAPAGSKINIDAGTFTVNNLPVTSTSGKGTVTVEKDGLSFKGYGVQFVDLEVAKESYFGKLSPMTVAYNSADESYTIQNAAVVKTLSNDFTKLTLDISAAEDYAHFEVNGKEFLVSSVADNLNVIEANGNTFKIQGKEVDAEKIGRVTIDEQLTFSGTAIDFDGVKTNYALNKPVIYSLDGKEITIDDAATVTTSDETKTYTCAAGSYVINGRSFETTAALTFTADTNQIKLPLNDATTEIYFDGVKVSGIQDGGEIVFDLANDKTFIPSGATLNITAPEEVKLNLAAGTFTIDYKEISSDTALEITADKDNVKVPLSETPVKINGAAITGSDAAQIEIDNTDALFFSILLPDGALVQNVSRNTFELSGKDSAAYFGDTNKKVQLTADGTAYVKYSAENTIGVGLNAVTVEQVEILGNDAWTVETSGTSGIDRITGIADSASILPLTEGIDAGDVRFEVVAGDGNIYVVRGDSDGRINVVPLADEFKDDDSEAAGKAYQFDAAGDYTVNGITFHAAANSKVQTITRGVEFDLSSGAFEYDGLTLEGSGTAQINRYNANLITLTDGATVSGDDESKYFNRQFEINGTIELVGKKFETNQQIRCELLNVQDTWEISVGDQSTEIPVTMSGFIVDDKYVQIQNDSYAGVRVVDGKIATIENVKASAEITGSGLSNVTIEATESGEFSVRGKLFTISGDSDGVTFITDSHGNLSEINGLVGSVEGNFENEILINGKAVRLTGASSVKVTSDGENITEISSVAGDYDGTYRKDVRVYSLGGAEKLTTSADGTIIFNGNKFEASAGKTFELNTAGEVVRLENAQSNELVSANVTENFVAMDLSTTDGLEEVFGDFSEGLTVNDVFVKVTDSTNFVVKNDEESVYIETNAADTFTINGKTFTTQADKTIFKLDADGNVSEIVTDTFLTGDAAYFIEGDFNDAIIFNGKKFCVTGINAKIFISDETLIGIELASNSVEVVESGGADEIAVSGAGEVTVGDKTFSTSEDFVGSLRASSIENFVGTISGKLGGLELEGITITTDDKFSATGDGEKLTALDNLNSGSFTCGELNGLTINGAEISVANAEEVTATITDGALTINGLKDSASVFNSGGQVYFVTGESGEFFIGEDEFKVTGDSSVTFAADSSGKVQEISGLDKGASLQTAQSGTFVVNGATLTVQADDIVIGLADGSAKIGYSDEVLNELIADNADAVIVDENITLSGGDMAVVEDTAAHVSITAGKGRDTIYTASKHVDIDLKAGGATEIFAAQGRITVENYDATTGAAFLTENENIVEAVAFDDGRLTVNAAQVTFADGAESKLINLVDAAGNTQKVGFVSDDAKLDLSKERGNLILVGASNSTLTGGAGKNQIYLDANSESTILLNGRNTIDNFNASFDGGDKISVDAATADFSFDGTNLKISNGSARAILQNISSDADSAKLLTVKNGAEIKTAIAQEDAIISAGDDLADIYVGKKSGVDFSAYDESLTLNLAGGSFIGINQITVGGGLNTLISSSANETLTSNSDGTTQFIFDAGAGHDVIKNFNFAEDKISVGVAVTNVVLRNSGDVIIQLGDEWITLEDAQGKQFQINEFTAQVDSNITYDDATNYFLATSKNASVTVGEEAEVWLDGSHGKNFVGNIRTLDASNSDGRNTLAGNDDDNIISAGLGDASLWGAGGNDILVGGKAHNLFFYTSGNDTIQAANDGDAVILSNVTLDQISGTNFMASGVAINFMSGGSLTIDSRADISYQLADGSQFSANHEQSTWQAK